jgi:hypothetical protein
VEVPFALAQMGDSPVFWELEESTAVSMIRTDYAGYNLKGFRLPFPAIWVGMPPLFSLTDPSTGEHPIEGFYLVEDWIPNRMEVLRAAGISTKRYFEGLTREERKRVEAVFRGEHMMYRSVLVIGVGESKNGVVRREVLAISGSRRAKMEHIQRDDTLLSFHVFTEDPERPLIKPRNEGERMLLNLTVSLLLALQDKYLHEEKVVPKKPKSPKKVKRALRRGESFAPFTVLKLKPSSRSYSSSGGGGGTRDRVIRGYWQHLWVKKENIGDRHVLAERQGKVSRLYKVRTWIRPNIIGTPTVRTTIVKE